MKNFKKPPRNAIGEGKANISQINVLNPDEITLVMRGKEWVNPFQPNYNEDHKQTVIPSIIRQNKEEAEREAERAKEVQKIEGKLYCRVNFLDAKIAFKIQKFKEIAPKITVKNLENTAADVARLEANKSR